MSKEDKLAAFRAFDFDSNEDWQSYFSRLEIPGGRDPAAITAKFKAKWYKREIDADFDVSWATSAPSAQPTPQAGQGSSGAYQRPSARPAASPKPAEPAAASRSAPTPSASSGGSRFSALGSPTTILFGMHTTLVVLTVMAVLPIRSSVAYYRYFMWLAVITHGYKVVQKNPLPAGSDLFAKLKAFDFSPVQNWSARAMGNSATDFQYAMMALVMSSSKRPISVAMIPIVVLAAYHSMAYANERLSGYSLWQKVGAKAHAWMTARSERALQMSAGCEIATGFVLIMNLLSPSRNFMMLFVYWNWLRTRYHTPDAHSKHETLWNYLGQSVAPYLAMVPALDGPLSFVKNWFLTNPAMPR